MTETNRIEYKERLTKDLDLEKEVIAFLNYHEGGSIYRLTPQVKALLSKESDKNAPQVTPQVQKREMNLGLLEMGKSQTYHEQL